MRNTLFLVCLLGVSCASLAQTGQSSWANLSGLRAGQKIQIVEISSKKHTGTFESVSDSAVSIKDAAGETSVQRQDVRIVKLMENHHRLRNTLVIGGASAGGGAIVGLAIGAAANKNNNGFFGPIVTTGQLTAIGAAGCGLIGTVVGTLLPSHETIYSVKAH
jgi:hypothetical protein